MNRYDGITWMRKHLWGVIGGSILLYILARMIWITHDDIFVWKGYSVGNLTNAVSVVNRWTIGVIGSLMVISVLLKTGSYLPKKSKRIIQILSMESLGIYTVHTFLLSLCVIPNASQFPKIENPILYCLMILAYTGVLLLITHLIIAAIKKIPYIRLFALGE